MCRVWCKYRDRVAGRQGIDGLLVRLRVPLFIAGKAVKRGVEIVVGFGDVLLEVLADCWESEP